MLPLFCSTSVWLCLGHVHDQCGYQSIVTTGLQENQSAIGHECILIGQTAERWHSHRSCAGGSLYKALLVLLLKYVGDSHSWSSLQPTCYLLEKYDNSTLNVVKANHWMGLSCMVHQNKIHTNVNDSNRCIMHCSDCSVEEQKHIGGTTVTESTVTLHGISPSGTVCKSVPCQWRHSWQPQ